ncbi:MAG TPA: 3-hydroxyacyl-CoA dehydrogenase NAD-binding domain-containing protein [Rhodothermales bacterium]
MKTVAIIGAGTMGAGIAQVCAASGLNVRLLDADQPALAAARARIEAGFDRLVAKQRLAPADRTVALERIDMRTAVSGQVSGVDAVIEAASERREAKEAVFRVVDAEADANALLASNTSSISITWIASRTSRPGSVVGMHFFNPVPVMELVEVVRGLETTEETMRRTIDLATALGKKPVVVNDAPGFVSNRVLMPLINEAAFCVLEGVAEPAAVDDVMRLGMRHPMGPLALADLIGIDVCVDILDVLHRDLGDDKYRACPLLRKMVAAGRLGRKTGRGFFEYEAR